MKINVRLLVILVCVIPAFLGIIVFVHALQMGRHASDYLVRAREGIKSTNVQDIKGAIRHYQFYLNQHPDEVDVRAEYGIALKDQGLPIPAIDQLEKVIRDAPDNTEALKALADMMMFQMGRPADARGHLKILTQLEPDNLEYRQQLAQCFILENNPQDAEKTLLAILEKDQTQVDSYDLLSGLYNRKLKRPKKAQELLDQMVDKNPESAKAYRIRAVHSYADKKTEEGDKDLAKALELAPKDKSTLLLAIKAAKSKGNSDEAKEYCKRLIEAEPESQEGYLQIAMLEWENVNFEKSLEWIEKGIKATGGTQFLTFHKIDRLLDLEKLPQVKKELKELTQTKFDPLLYAYLQARKDYAEGNWNKAKNQFEAIRPGLERVRGLRILIPRVNLLVAECYRQLGNPEKGQELLSRMRLSGMPSVNQSSLQEGRAFAREGKVDQAIAYYKAILRQKPSAFDTHLELFHILIQKAIRQKEEKRDWSEVNQALDEVKKQFPDDPQVALFEAQFLIAQGPQNAEKVEAVLEKAIQQAKSLAQKWDKLIEELKTTSDSEKAVQLLTKASETWAKKNAYLEQGIELVQKGNRDRALRILGFGKRNQINTDRLWGAWITVAQSQKNWDRAEEIARRGISESGDSVVFRKAIANTIMKRGGDDASVRLETVLKDIDKLPETEQQQLWQIVAVDFERLGKTDRAIELCETAAKKKPNDLFTRRMLFKLALEAGKKDLVDKTLEQIGEIDQEGPVWNYLNAFKISYPFHDKKILSEEERETLEVAVDYLNAAEVQRPNWGTTALLLGKLHDKMGNSKAAITDLARAVELGERDKTGLARLAELYIKQNRALEAQTILDMLRHSGGGLNPAGQIIMANLKFHQGDKRGALAELLGAVQLLRRQVESSEDAVTFIGLAQALSSAANLSRQLEQEKIADALLQEARDIVKKASEVDPSDHRPWLILADYYHEQEENDKVEEVIAAIKKNVPEEQREITLARCYETLGRVVDAELAYKKALEVASKENDIAKRVVSFYSRSDQEKRNRYKNLEDLLRKMIQGKLPAGDQDIRWARRRLALVLFMRGLQKYHKEAMQLVEENLKENPDSLRDLRVQSRGFAIEGTRKGKQQAIEVLEKLVKRPHTSDDDRFQLAKLHWASDNWSGVSRQMQVLLGKSDPNPEWYEFYIQYLIDRNELSSAQVNWEKLKRMRPKTFTTAELASLIHAAMGKPDKAIEDLKAYLADTKTLPNNALSKLENVAQAAEELANRVQNQNDEAGKKAREQYLDLAEKAHKDMADLYGKTAMDLASFYGRYGQRDKAIRLAERTWRTNEPQTIAAVTISLLHTGEVTPAQIKRVEKILNLATNHFGDSVIMDMAKAELRTIQKRYDEAEKIYRKVLKENENNVFAMNNLAVFLALRNTKLDDALDMINKTIELRGPMATLLDSRATVYLARGELQKALDDIDAALRHDDTAVRYFHQAQILMKAGQKQEAKKSFNKAIKLGLQADQLQPLERPGFRALRESLR